MIVAGIDIGSRAAKAVVINDGNIVSSVICDTGPESVKTSQMTMARVLDGTGLSLDNVEYVWPRAMEGCWCPSPTRTSPR